MKNGIIEMINTDCKHCERPIARYVLRGVTVQLEDLECDRCWELRTRIESDPAIAERMLNAWKVRQ